MPRSACIVACGALHHIICRGIERKRIFQNEFGRNGFLNRLFGFTRQTATRCLAWALMTNHFYLLIETGRVPAKRHNFQKEK